MKKHILLLSVALLFFSILSYVFSNSEPVTLESLYEDYPIVIGKGGHGEIRTAEENMVAIKISKKEDICVDYRKEFDIQSKIYEVYEQLSHPEGFKERATILKPYQYKETKTHDFCFFKMERLQPISEESKLLYQLYFGKDDYDKIEGTRGHYIGFKQINQLVSKYPRLSTEKSNIEQVCYDFGRLLAIVQLAAKFDALDYELVLSKSRGTTPYKISIIDFDQMTSIAKYFKNFQSQNVKTIVEKTSWPLRAEEYIPKLSTPYYEHFKNGYLDLAKQLDEKEETNFYTTTANAILDHYKEKTEEVLNIQKMIKKQKQRREEMLARQKKRQQEILKKHKQQQKTTGND